MPLGQRVTAILFEYFLNHWPFFVILAVMSVFCSQWYEDYYRINRETDHVDLMKRYLWLKMRRRYGPDKKV